MTQKERMVAGLLYNPLDEELTSLSEKAAEITYQFNQCRPSDKAQLQTLLSRLLGKHGKDCWIKPPFRCDYGFNIEIGDSFFANYNCVILDCAPVKIGNCCMFAPNVSLYTAGHPLHPENRNTWLEYAAGISIGNNVWLGGNVVVNPGVTIGDNVVVGSGSVVTKNIPANSLAVGNPARVLREITDEDKKFGFRREPFKF